MNLTDPTALPRPGWYATLIASARDQPGDQEVWHRELTDPADAMVAKGPIGMWFLTSEDMQEAVDHHDAGRRARALLDRLNIRMAIDRATLPLVVNTVDLIKPDGGRISLHSMDGGLLAEAPREAPREPKERLKALPKPDRVRLLLVQRAKPWNWANAYGTLELAELMVGGAAKLERLLAGRAGRYRAMRAWANRFRHETPGNDADEFDVNEAVPLVDHIVRKALVHAVEARVPRSTHVENANRTAS